MLCGSIPRWPASNGNGLTGALGRRAGRPPCSRSTGRARCALCRNGNRIPPSSLFRSLVCVNASLDFRIDGSWPRPVKALAKCVLLRRAASPRFLSPEQTFPHLSEGGYRDEPGSPSPPSHAMSGGLQVRWTRTKAHPRPLCGNGGRRGSPCPSPQQTEWPPWCAAKIDQCRSAASQIGLLSASSICSHVNIPFSTRTLLRQF